MLCNVGMRIAGLYTGTLAVISDKITHKYWLVTVYHNCLPGNIDSPWCIYGGLSAYLHCVLTKWCVTFCSLLQVPCVYWRWYLNLYIVLDILLESVFGYFIVGFAVLVSVPI